MRAFVGRQLDLLNEHTDIDAGVVIVRTIDTDFLPSLSTQNGLYTTIIRGLNDQGDAVRQSRVIRSVNSESNVYRQFDEYLALAHDANIWFVFSTTTEADISFNDGYRLQDTLPQSYPVKLTRLLSSVSAILLARRIKDGCLSPANLSITTATRCAKWCCAMPTCERCRRSSFTI